MFLCGLEHLDALVVIEARGLSCRSQRNKEVYPCRHLTVGKSCERFIIHLAVPEGGDQCGSAACKIYIAHILLLLKKQFLKFMDSGQAFGAEGSLNCSCGKAFARKGLMGHGDAVVRPLIAHRMNA